MFVSHDLAVAGQLASEVAVLRRGELVEPSSAEQLFAHPQAANTQDLLAAIPGQRGALQSVLREPLAGVGYGISSGAGEDGRASVSY